MTTQQRPIPPGGAPLERVATRFREMWELVHGPTGSTARATLDGATLTIRLERVLTPAELRLKRDAHGLRFVQTYLERLLDQIYPTLAPSIEAACGVEIAHAGVHSDPASGCLTCTVHFRRPPRLPEARAVRNAAVPPSSVRAEDGQRSGGGRAPDRHFMKR